MLPNFLVLGAGRSGTTWLHAVLSSHPQIHLPDSKEPDFLNRRILSEPFSNYTELFDPPPGKEPKPLRGDMSVNYSNLLTPVVRKIGQLLPGAKLVYTVRHPVDRLWSSLKYTYGTFSGKVMRHVPLAKFMRACHCSRFTRRNDYFAVIQRWGEVFGAESLHVDLFDRIEADPRGYIYDVLAHLGADTTFEIPAELLEVKIHSTDVMEMPDIFRWYVSCQWLESTKRLNELLDGRVSHWVETMAQDASRSTFSRRLLREFNRSILSLPEKLAYAAYDAQRQRALVKRLDDVLRHDAIGGGFRDGVAAENKVAQPILA